MGRQKLSPLASRAPQDVGPESSTDSFIQFCYSMGSCVTLRSTERTRGSVDVKYFVDPDTHWDVAGYWQQLDSLKTRLSKSAFRSLSQTSFHDAELLALHCINLGPWGRRRTKDPTEVTLELWHPNEYVYTLR